MINSICRAVLAALLLAACGSEPSADAARTAAADSARAAPTTAAGPMDSVPGDPRPNAAPAIVLAPDGLEITGGAAPGRVAFGEGQARVLAATAAVLGAPQGAGVQEECPAGPLYQTTFSTVQLVFQDSAFVGWAARTPSPLRTAEGVGPGSTQAGIRAAYPAATVSETSLGTEFAAGDLYGVFADSTSPARLEFLFAGINCIFR